MALWTSIGDGKITPEVLVTFMESIGLVRKLSTVCSTVEDGPRGKLAFRYTVSQFSRDCHEILQTLLSNHLATTQKISRNSIEYFKS